MSHRPAPVRRDCGRRAQVRYRVSSAFARSVTSASTRWTVARFSAGMSRYRWCMMSSIPSRTRRYRVLPADVSSMRTGSSRAEVTRPRATELVSGRQDCEVAHPEAACHPEHQRLEVRFTSAGGEEVQGNPLRGRGFGRGQQCVEDGAHGARGLADVLACEGWRFGQRWSPFASSVVSSGSGAARSFCRSLMRAVVRSLSMPPSGAVSRSCRLRTT